MSTTEPTTHPRFSQGEPLRNQLIERGLLTDTNTANCPTPPTLQSEVASINEALDAAGASQECKSTFNSSQYSNIDKVDAAVGISTVFGSAGAALSTTNASQALASALSDAGCSDIFVNVQQQINSTQNILCTINETAIKTSVTYSSRASIRITQLQPSDAEAARRTGVQNTIANAKSNATQAYFAILPNLNTDQARAAREAYLGLMASYDRQSDIVGGLSVITNSDFSINAGTQIDTITSTDNVDTVKIATEVKKAAATEAIQEINRRSGYGSGSGGRNLKDIVNTRIENKTTNLNTDISRTMSDVMTNASNTAEFEIQHYGPMIIDNLVVDVSLQARIMTQNIMDNAKALGQQVAMEILSDSATASTRTENQSGQDTVLREIFQGQTNLSRANAEGVSNALNTFMGGSGGMMGIIIIILIIIAIFMFGFKKVFSVVFPMTEPGGGPMKYVMQILIFLVIYLIIALIFRFWPFSSSENNNKLMQSLEYSKRVFPPLGGEFSRRRDHERDRGLYGM